MRRSRTAAALITVLALAAGCSSGGSDPSSGGSSGSGGSSTTRAEALAPEAAYAERGPHEVGSTTIETDDGRRTVVWYPAAASAADQPTELFDIASLLTPELQAKIPAELRPQYEIDAHIGAAPADDGPFPVVLFSHGFAGFPEQSADLVTHLASWGFVVVAPDHVERSLSGLLGTAAQGVATRTDPDVLGAALDAALAEAERSGSPVEGLLDGDHVAAAGHSAGAAAAYLTAKQDSRVKAFITYSVGAGDGDEDRLGDAPEVPGMVMLGTNDGIIEPAESRAVYDRMSAPRYRVEIEGAGHLVFSDICEIGKDQGGLVSLVHQVGLDIPENLLELAKDGCEEGDLPPTRAFAAIDHLSVAFLRHELVGVDEDPGELDPSIARAFTTADVTITADP